MVTLIGRWESGWLDNKVELFIWKQLCHAYNVDKLVMVGISDNPRITIDQYESIEEAIENNNGQVILLEPSSNLFLEQFEHPKDAMYIFGNAKNHNLNIPGIKIRINTPNDVDMFAFNVASIVLADRK